MPLMSQCAFSVLVCLAKGTSEKGYPHFGLREMWKDNLPLLHVVGSCGNETVALALSPLRSEYDCDGSHH